MIQLKNLDIGYKTKRETHCVYQNINLVFNTGSLVGLIGNNGVGKSTLIKTIVGNLTPLNGDIIINDKTIIDFSNQELSTLISIVTTEKIGGFNLSVYDVVSLGRTPYISLFGKLEKSDELIIEQSLASLEILDLKNKLIDELSDGQRQKVLIAKSLAQQTPIIILDEPTAFLDYNSKNKLFQSLKKLCEEQNKLIIVSSHDIDLMQKYISVSVQMKDENSIEII